MFSQFLNILRFFKVYILDRVIVFIICFIRSKVKCILLISGNCVSKGNFLCSQYWVIYYLVFIICLVTWFVVRYLWGYLFNYYWACAALWARLISIWLTSLWLVISNIGNFVVVVVDFKGWLATKCDWHWKISSLTFHIEILLLSFLSNSITTVIVWIDLHCLCNATSIKIKRLAIFIGSCMSSSLVVKWVNSSDIFVS